MEAYLKSLRADVWFSVASGYNSLKKPKTAAQKEAKRNNKLAIDTILDGLTDSVKSKVGSCASSKEIWDKLQDLYVRKDAEEEDLYVSWVKSGLCPIVKIINYNYQIQNS